ncbi:hypothetical protein CALCODRAFT_202395 [Calocera cornea HHB12733]|uniref:RBR-type E3 ubiquitin transferase n=1 Tax=Calocera cornea HHB12733 TaxID=1353952 RepID=A0A165JY44_9BASI|nr:hypothetical protein CALCODRAFT_202395 [Calocera cornea HHB12733]
MYLLPEVVGQTLRRENQLAVTSTMETTPRVDARVLQVLPDLMKGIILVARNDSSTDDSSDGPTGWADFGIFVGFFLASCFLFCCCKALCVECCRGRRTNRRRAPPVLPLHTQTVAQAFAHAYATTLITPPAAVIGDASILKECKVCMEELGAARFSPMTPSKACTHEVNVCNDCLQRHVDQRLSALGTVPPSCPSPSCRFSLSYHEVKRAASSDSFARFDLLLLRKAVGNEQGFVWCKNAKCDAGQFHIIPETPKRPGLFRSGNEECSNPDMVVCIACGTKSCFRHDVPWHEGMTCKEYERSKEVKPIMKKESQTIRRIEKKTRACPRCKAPVEKNGGCDNMYCLPPGGCGHHFRWKDAHATRVSNRR